MDDPMESDPWLARPRDVVRCAGGGAEKYLHSQLSQDIRALQDGERVWSFLLAPTGKVDALVGVRRVDADTFDLDVDAGFADVVEARLRRFMIRVQATISLLGTTSGDPLAGEAERIEARWPAMGTEIVPGETIPAETGVIPAAVSFTKGCYPGQELVERMDARGAVARRHLVTIDAGRDTAPGDVVRSAGHGDVTVTSVSGGRAIGWAGRR